VQTLTTKGTAPLATALVDPWLFNSSQQKTAFAKARAAEATYVRLTLDWNLIAPESRPDAFVATDPTSPGYSWGDADVFVQEVEAAGLTPIIDIQHRAELALTRRRLQGIAAGTPKATALGDFATALAKQYDGSTPGVPAHVFQVWNEPNVSLLVASLGVRLRLVAGLFPHPGLAQAALRALG
jgi:hypothetical protein